MFKFLLILVTVVFLSACGVDTSSSPYITAANTGDNTDTPDDNITSSDDNITDDDGTSTGGGTSSGDTESLFDTVDAIEDPNACTSNGYRVASDASYGGSLTGENGSDGFVIPEHGLVIRSEYLSQEDASTWVTLFYKGFPSFEDLNLQGTTSYKMDNVFYISYDLAWADESISGINNRMYVQSSKAEKLLCYRLDLNNITGSLIGIQKVYRISL